MSTTKFGWGIIGLGNIASSFATGLQSIDDAELIGVGSRSQEKADAFAERFHAQHAYSSYEELAANPDIDAIYIATPHTSHCENTIMCLNAGKAVLCEKPFAVNLRQANAMVTAAKTNNVFLLEAMWTRYLPLIVKVRELLATGAIGEPRMLQADFGFQAGFNPESRLFNPELGGGALLDVGVYTLSLASMVFGTPTAVAGLANLGQSGVDEESAFVLKHSKGQLSILSTAIRLNTLHEAVILGTEGSIRIHSPWWVPKSLTLKCGGAEEVLEIPFVGNGYNYEALEVMDCVRAGKVESSTLPLGETLEIQSTMELLREQWGLKYPSD